MLDWSDARRPTCTSCAASFDSQDGVIALVANGKEAEWEQAESRLNLYLRDHPDRERALRTTPREVLNPADLFYLSLLLEEEGHLEESDSCAELAVRRC